MKPHHRVYITIECVCVCACVESSRETNGPKRRCAMRSRSRFYFHRNGNNYIPGAACPAHAHLFMLRCACLRLSRVCCVCVCVVHTILHQIGHARLHSVPRTGHAARCVLLFCIRVHTGSSVVVVCATATATATTTTDASKIWNSVWLGLLRVVAACVGVCGWTVGFSAAMQQS